MPTISTLSGRSSFSYRGSVSGGVVLEMSSEYGNCSVPRHYENKKLAYWIVSQRFIKDKLDSERQKRLDDLGFIWDPLNAAWEEMYSVLVEYKSVYGDCDVPKESIKYKKLFTWLVSQKIRNRENRILEAQLQRLIELGVSFKSIDDIWGEMYSELIQYKNEYGDCIIREDCKQFQNLATWVKTQRRGYKEGTISNERVDLLNNIGFCWDMLAHAWELKYCELKEFYEKHGTFLISDKNISYKDLGIWVGHQRKAYKNKQLTEYRFDLLNKIGFVWDIKQTKWEENFIELVQYKNEYGDCNVPQRAPKFKKLATWVRTQRHNRKNDALSESRFTRLNELGFIWNEFDNYWECMYEKLSKYKSLHGDCNVPRDHKEYYELNMWVRSQRKARFKNSEDKIEQLNKIGFIWSIRDYEWEENFNALVRYKSENGHCKVPLNNKQKNSLAIWVNEQRTQKKRDKITDDKIKRLDEIGFVWEPSKQTT